MTRLLVCALSVFVCNSAVGQMVMTVPPTTKKVDVTSATDDSGSTTIEVDESVNLNGKITSDAFYVLEEAKEFTLTGSVEIGYEKDIIVNGEVVRVDWVRVGDVITVQGTHLFPKTVGAIPPSSEQVFDFDEKSVSAPGTGWNAGSTHYAREYVLALRGKNMEDWDEADTLNRGTASFDVPE